MEFIAMSLAWFDGEYDKYYMYYSVKVILDTGVC